MRRGRPLKTHPHSGGATLPTKIFVPSMGLFCVSAFGCFFALAGYKNTPTTQAITYIYMSFVCTGASVRLSVLCLV